MNYLGELISIGVAFSWTATALLSEFGSKRLGNLTLNVLRMALAIIFAMVMLCSPTRWHHDGGLWLDAAFRFSGLRHRRLLPLPVLYHHRLPLRTVVYDIGPTSCRPDGLDHPRTRDEQDEYPGDDCHTGRHQHLRTWTRRAP